MKLKLNIKTARNLAIASLAVISFSSCKKNNIAVDVDALNTPDAPALAINAASRTAMYYVSPTSAPYKIPVTVMNVSTGDRAFNIAYTSNTATAGVQYSAPSTVTVKAGSVGDSLAVQGIFAGLTAAKDTVKIKFSGTTGLYAKDSFMLVLLKSCPVVLTNMSGAFPGTEEYNSAGVKQWGPYTVDVLNLVAGGSPNTATGQFDGLYDFDWGPINFTMDYSNINPGLWTVTIPLQTTGSTGSGVTHVRGSAGKTNTFSACDQTFTITLDLMTDATTVGAAAYQFRIKR
ncbi:MAG TPA: hypothetical protein PLU36_05165 [Chitinophagaceae bacterium]|nr:hypothetical protein [Chitinophagaceae bacterium]MCC6634686.1 hypothetical protein [Chitinophagaceae bacterium]HMZ46173.1 hypothetical protein [Chitinophagaceae bacterium]HNM33918.1 hypothetical protein [Chitinophagaceae bacterium]HNN31037.1 hypothetical protein [Chitinophagaceae bacterium]